MTVTATHNRADTAAGPSDAEPRTLFELFRQSSTRNPSGVAFRLKRDGSWTDVTWSEHAATVAAVTKGLLALDVTAGDCVAILSGTRLEWVQCDSAIVNSGAVTVGIYHSNLAPDCAFILNHAEVGVVFVEDDEQLQKVQEVRGELPGVRHVIVFDGDGDPSTGVLSWAEFLAGGGGIDDERLEQVGSRIAPGDLASLVYTSGTTGEPKGAMITHENLVFVAKAASVALYIEPHFTTLLFLPLAHVFARMIAYMCQRSGLAVVFCEDLSKVAANLKEVRPHFIASVPRIYEKVHEKVVTSVEDAGGFKSKLFAWAVDVGRRAARLRLAGRPVPAWLALRHAVADRLVLHKVRDAFGGRLVWAVSGAAPLNTRINEFYHACGLTIIEGLGQTENTSLSNTNRIDHNKIGTVGPTVPGVEMKLAADGEVLFRGPNIMKGYFKNPEATADTINAEGWLHSGDIGEIDEDGFLTITDRKKDLIITAGGKNVAPQRIERTLRTSRFISQVVACGDRRKFISALITLDSVNTRQWAQDNGLGSLGDEELARASEVRELIEQEITERNNELASYESVKKFRILPRDLSIEAGELTPTLKIKRKVVCDKHRALLEEMYRG